jgi:hypothetical protein
MSKENTYDNEISPLMAKVIDICKANSIGMVATFDLDDDLCCTSSIPDETGKLSDRLRRCAIEAQNGRPSLPPLMITTTKPDGSKTMTAIVA